MKTMSLQTQTTADPTADVPPHEAQLNSYIAKQLAGGVPHRYLLEALLNNFRALAIVYPCCAASAGKAALQVGGQLIVSAIERPANASVH